MQLSQHNSRGFTLTAALLIIILLSGVAVGLLYVVSSQTRMGGNDLEGTLAYYGAEAGIENLTAELSTLYQTSQNPTPTAICALQTASNPATVSGSSVTSVNYGQYIWYPNAGNAQLTQPPVCPTTTPVSTWDVVGAGQDQGMVANMIPFTLEVTATRAAGAGQTSYDASAATGAAVNMTRTVEVALLPAFEFGIFCDGDCDYFAGPPFNFGGRVHTNGNLFLAANSGPLTLTNKVTAVGQVILTQLENGQVSGPGASDYAGTVYVPNAAGGCPNAPGAGPAANCIALPSGSWTGGYPPTGSTVGTWTGVSKSTFNGFIETGATGASSLQLPFVNADKVGAVEIIRKPTSGDTPLLANSRLYNEASIRILLADFEGDLYPGETRSDSATQDIQIGSPFTNSSNGSYVAVSAATGVTSAGNMYFAMAQPQSASNNWATAAPTGCTSSTAAASTWPNWPLFGQVTVSGKQCQGAWLRVEYCPTTAAAGGNCTPSQWVGVTTQWLGYGFGRNYNNPPTQPYNSSTTTAPLCKSYTGSTTNMPLAGCQNGVSPAILILQQLQEGVATSGAMGAASTANNWLPLNFYDAREGEPRDARPTGDTGGTTGANADCSPVGIMNVVELDVGNLWLWLQAASTTPYSTGSGKLVNAATYNGYILYFADHRGMIPDKYPMATFYNGFSGMSGLNDVVNSGSAVGVPDGKLETITYYATAPVPFSPEDVAVKGAAVNLGNVDNWGEANLGAGFGIAAGSMAQPYYIYGSVTTNAVQCTSYSGGAPKYGVTTAEWNMVTGPRHALRLVDGGMNGSDVSYVPPSGGSTATNGNGFTVASEEPVYVWGNYNTNSSDPFWPSEGTLGTSPGTHSASAIIADAVTLLSNPPAGNTAPTTYTGWTDLESFLYPACAVATGNCTASRPGNTSYYRMAIIGGKNIPCPNPGWSTEPDFCTDGGMHNFLRYLEDRGANGANVNYAGSMISMYYSQYATGVFKCCTSVYGAPTRNYFFDTLFENPANLPPGTPSFEEVVSLGYHQSFTPQ